MLDLIFHQVTKPYKINVRLVAYDDVFCYAYHNTKGNIKVLFKIHLNVFGFYHNINNLRYCFLV